TYGLPQCAERPESDPPAIAAQGAGRGAFSRRLCRVDAGGGRGRAGCCASSGWRREMSFFGSLRGEIAAFGKREGAGWLFVLKTVLAVLLAMGISLRLDLGQP